MFSSLNIAIITVAYLLLLFAIAYLGDRIPQSVLRKMKPYLVALAGTYTTAWMFFGTPAQALTNGWYIPPTFMGTIPLLILGGWFFVRLLKASNAANSTSIADFIASFYGNKQYLAVLVTAVSLIAVLPYISLQLRAVSMSFQLISGGSLNETITPTFWQDTAFYIAILMAIFTIAFGTRHINRNEHHNGVMIAIAFESLVKLSSFVCVGSFVCFFMYDGVEDFVVNVLGDNNVIKLIENRSGDSGYTAALVLGMAAIFCLPRQFQILFVHSDQSSDVNTWRWLIPLYLLTISFFILPIAYGGFVLFNGDLSQAESFVIQLPLQQQQPMLALVAYVGGLSAGSAMVILSCIALSTMVCNHLVMPLILQQHWLLPKTGINMVPVLRNIRRIAIIVILALAYIYYQLLGENDELGSIGLLALALVAQFAPAVVAAVFWGRGHAQAVAFGIAAGFLLWAYTLLLPALVRSNWLDPSLLILGPWQLSWLRPEALFNWQWAALSNGVFWSLASNSVIFFLISWYKNQQQQHSPNVGKTILSIGELEQIAARFLGQQQAELALQQFHSNKDHHHSDIADENFIGHVESLLAGIIGSASAEQVVRGTNRNQPELSVSSQVFQFSHALLQSSMDNISQGISVIDANLRLVAWNKAYLQLYHYPEDMIHVGRPIKDLIRYNAEQGLMLENDIESAIDKRLQHLVNGDRYLFQRHRSDGKVLEIRGTPMPEGAYVTTYTDITSYQNSLSELKKSRDNLERRVDQRTAALTLANRQLSEANTNKTRFLAAASHDLVQPLNASRLFISSLQQQTLPTSQQQLVDHLANAIDGAENLITELLEIAKLDAGVIQPKFEVISLNDFLQTLTNDFQALAQVEGIKLSHVPCSLFSRTDPALLRRIMHNLLSNAIRYGEQGRVLIGVRRATQGLDTQQLYLEVWDNGPGIPQSQHEAIFEEFLRLNQHQKHQGLGLGLATVKRLSLMLNHPLSVNSRVGKGSVFRLQLNRNDNSATPDNNSLSTVNQVDKVQGLRVLCIENDPAVLAGMEALLSSWGCDVFCASNQIEAVSQSDNKPQIILADYHLDRGETGLHCVALVHKNNGILPCIIISADRTDQAKQHVQGNGFVFLQKPIKPAALRAAMNRAMSKTRLS